MAEALVNLTPFLIRMTADHDENSGRTDRRSASVRARWVRMSSIKITGDLARNLEDLSGFWHEIVKRILLPSLKQSSLAGRCG
jgi:hypothetical protein